MNAEATIDNPISDSALSRNRMRDTVLHAITRTAAIGVLIMLSGVIITLIHGSLPALDQFGFSFLHTESWTSAPRPRSTAP